MKLLGEFDIGNRLCSVFLVKEQLGHNEDFTRFRFRLEYSLPVEENDSTYYIGELECTYYYNENNKWIFDIDSLDIDKHCRECGFGTLLYKSSLRELPNTDIVLGSSVYKALGFWENMGAEYNDKDWVSDVLENGLSDEDYGETFGFEIIIK